MVDRTNRSSSSLRTTSESRSPNDLPTLGSTSRGLRILSESWNATTQAQLTLEGFRPCGNAAIRWTFGIPAQISSVEGAALTKLGKLEIQMSQGADAYVQQKVVIHFGRS